MVFGIYGFIVSVEINICDIEMGLNLTAVSDWTYMDSNMSSIIGRPLNIQIRMFHALKTDSSYSFDFVLLNFTYYIDF